MTEPIGLNYDLRLLPRGRTPFQRWHWELWNGATMISAGWHFHPLQAQRTMRIHAVRYAHRINGLRVIRPDVDHPTEAPWRGRPVTIDWGEMRIELTPVSPEQSRLSRGQSAAAASD
jgi:hypothetical protein